MDQKNDDRWLTTIEAAAYLGYTPGSLRVARTLNKLAGVEPPKHSKAGTAVRYRKADLDSWVKGE